MSHLLNLSCASSMAICRRFWKSLRFTSTTILLARPMSHKAGSLSVAPPTYNGPLDVLDKDAFNVSLKLLAAKIQPRKTQELVNSRVLRRYLPGLAKVSPVAKGSNGERFLLLGVKDLSELSSEAHDLLKAEGEGFVEHEIRLGYDHWSAGDVIQSILPPELRDGAPVGFATTGHIAHLNLNAEYLPYKYQIGQIFLDKLPLIKTVVNKLDNIDNQFRVFKMEILAGEPNYIVEHRESECTFTFDFSKVYWNSRLQAEHNRLIGKLSPHDVLADVFAGVGPFALPAGKRGCGVFANDLNPDSYKYLDANAKANSVDDVVRTTCEDGRDFIRTVFQRIIETPFPAYTGPRLSKSQLLKQRKAEGRRPPQDAQPATSAPPRRKITHVAMNLPDSAISFLDAFRGVLRPEDAEVYDELPTIHCYCFSREIDPDKATRDVKQRVEEKLGHVIADGFELHHVRSVAPAKEMYCISFRLPAEVAYARTGA